MSKPASGRTDPRQCDPIESGLAVRLYGARCETYFLACVVPRGASAEATLVVARAAGAITLRPVVPVGAV